MDLAVKVEPVTSSGEAAYVTTANARVEGSRGGGSRGKGPSERAEALMHARLAEEQKRQTLDAKGRGRGKQTGQGTDDGNSVVPLPTLPRVQPRLHTPPALAQHGRMMPHGVAQQHKDQRDSQLPKYGRGYMPPLPPVPIRRPNVAHIDPATDEPLTPDEWLAQRQRMRVEGARRWRRSQREAAAVFKKRPQLKLNEQHWLATRNKVQRFEFSYVQKRALRKWFDSMDADGSGDISVNELTDALVSTGLTKYRAEAERLFASVDSDGTGEIDFDEFLDVLNPTGSSNTDMLSTERLQEFIPAGQTEGAMDIGSKVNEKRRRLLLETITSLYKIKEKPEPSASMKRRQSLEVELNVGDIPEDKEKEKERAEKNGLLNNLLEAVERWKTREVNKALEEEGPDAGGQ